MPLYDFECGKCHRVEKDVFLHKWDEVVKCRCGSVMQKLIVTRVKAKVFPAEGVFLEHVSPTGKRFYSEKEMRDYAKEHSLELGYLL